MQGLRQRLDSKLRGLRRLPMAEKMLCSLAYHLELRHGQQLPLAVS